MDDHLLNKIPAIAGGNPVREKEKYIIFGSPRIDEEEIQEVVETLRSGWIGTGPKVKKFEEMIQNYLNAKNAVALNSCTAALHLSMLATGIKEGDEVITTPMTFAATANSIAHTGAKPVFVDIKKETMNIDPRKIEDAITEKTKAIMPVHFAGRPCEMDYINNLANKYGLIVIEDAAHALGAEYKGKKIGSLGNPTCFSFYVTKNITTIEGGMVTTDDEVFANKIKILGLHGMSKDAWKRFSDEGYKHYFVNYRGFKYNMTDVQASLGIHQLPKIDQWHNIRTEIWNRYNKAFKDLPVILPAPEEEDTKHAKHIYNLILKTEELIKDRDWILDSLHREGIGGGVHYTSLHLHPIYRRMGYKPGHFPNTEYIGDRTLTLPLSAKLNEQDVEDIISAVTKVLNYYSR